MKIARRESPHRAAGAAALRIAKASAYPLRPVRIPVPDPPINQWPAKSEKDGKAIVLSIDDYDQR
jgi:hypothetical protein